MVVEGIMTGLVVLVCNAFWDRRCQDKHDSLAVKLGLAIGALALPGVRHFVIITEYSLSVWPQDCRRVWARDGGWTDMATKLKTFASPESYTLNTYDYQFCIYYGWVEELLRGWKSYQFSSCPGWVEELSVEFISWVGGKAITSIIVWLGGTFLS